MPIPEPTVVVERKSATVLVFEQLRTWIENGTLESGEAIKETAVANRLGVSRTPVREALGLLKQLGAVETLPGRFATVSEVHASDLALVLPPLAALHGEAAALAAPKITTNDIERLEAANEALAASLSGKTPSVKRKIADDRFHGLILEIAANPFVSNAIEPLALHARRLDILYFTHDQPSRQSYEDHCGIVRALADHDAESAREVTRTNWLRTLDRLQLP
jgi:DNA-binding GntR family transcriptional regulator